LPAHKVSQLGTICYSHHISINKTFEPTHKRTECSTNFATTNEAVIATLLAAIFPSLSLTYNPAVASTFSITECTAVDLS
jgi:hypothetical protein